MKRYDMIVERLADTGTTAMMAEKKLGKWVKHEDVQQLTESEVMGTYTETDMMAAFVQGYKNAEYRFRCLPNLRGTKTDGEEQRVGVSFRSTDAELEVRKAIERGDHRGFSVWLSDYNDDKERRERLGFHMPQDGVTVQKVYSHDNGDSII